MANELLKFRKGLYANLKNLAKDPGTIYVTTDEQAMYVDLDANTRIRLGETIHFANLEAFNSFLNATEPPYDTRAFYYIDKENALLKWSADGTGNYQGKGTWKQINSTAALTTELNKVKEDISGLNTAVANNTTAIANNTTAIATNTTAIGTASTGDGSGKDDDNKKATGLHALIEANEKAIKSNDEDIKNLQDNKLDKTSFETFKTENAAAIKAVDDKVGTKTDAATADTAFGRIKALEESNATKASQADVNALKTTVYGGTDLTQDTAADGSLVKKVASLETNSATKAELKTTDDKANTNATNITAINSKLGTSADEANKNTAFQRIEALEDAVGGSNGNSLGDRVTAVEKTLNGDTATGDQGLVKDVEDLEKALGDKANPAAGTIYKEIADIKTKDGQQDTSIANLEKTLNGDSTAVEGSDAKLGIAGRLTAVENQADATDQEIGTKDSSITETTLWDAIKANKNAAAANANAIGDANSGLTKKVNDNTTSIGENKTEITNIKTAIGSKTDEATKDTVYGAINKNAAAISGLETTLLEKIKAANEMTYKGGVASYSDLPDIGDNIQVGDTYVATGPFTYKVTDDQGVETTVQVYAGDFLIAHGVESDTTGFILSNLVWTHVNTGYIDEHESKLGVTAVTEEKDGATVQTAAQVNLTSHVAGTGVYGDLGKILFNSDNLAITSTYSEATNTGNITINAIWKDF